jgi:hypothetical protein
MMNQCTYSIAAINQCTYSIVVINQCTYSIAVINQCTYSIAPAHLYTHLTLSLSPSRLLSLSVWTRVRACSQGTKGPAGKEDHGGRLAGSRICNMCYVLYYYVLYGGTLAGSRI